MLLVPSHFTPYVVSLQPNRSGRKNLDLGLTSPVYGTPGVIECNHTEEKDDCNDHGRNEHEHFKFNGISEEASRNHCQTQVAVVTDEAEQKLQFPPGLDDKIQAVFCVKMLNSNYIKRDNQCKMNSKSG